MPGQDDHSGLEQVMKNLRLLPGLYLENIAVIFFRVGQIYERTLLTGPRPRSHFQAQRVIDRRAAIDRDPFRGLPFPISRFGPRAAARPSSANGRFSQLLSSLFLLSESSK